jgi:hypothetical protein
MAPILDNQHQLNFRVVKVLKFCAISMLTGDLTEFHGDDGRHTIPGSETVNSVLLSEVRLLHFVLAP